MTFKLHPELKTKWLDALRSGDYKQGQGVLCAAGPDGSKSHCCLGVLADVIDPKGWDEQVTTSKLRPAYYNHKLSSAEDVSFVAGEYLRSNIIPNVIQEKLAHLNDVDYDYGDGFTNTIKFIEEKL